MRLGTTEPLRTVLAGATGVIGRRLLPALLAAGHQVTALTRSEARLDGLRAAGADPVLVDVYDRAALIEAVRKAAPDVILHQLTDLSTHDFAANGRIRHVGTRHLVDAARAAGVERIIAQSINWAYEDGDRAADERTPLDLNATGGRKRMVAAVAALERTTMELSGAVVLRNGLFYGPGTWYDASGDNAAAARAGRLVADDDITSFVHVDDAAAAVLAALDWPPGVVNICDDEPATGHEWLPVFCQAVDAPPPPMAPPGHRTPAARGADNSYARTELGWTPRFPTWRTGFFGL